MREQPFFFVCGRFPRCLLHEVSDGVVGRRCAKILGRTQYSCTIYSDRESCGVGDKLVGWYNAGRNDRKPLN